MSDEPHHLSKLRLDRYHTGELSPEEAAIVEERLDDRARAHLEAVAKVQVPPLDITALRARASRLADESATAVYDDAIVPPQADDSKFLPEPIDLAERRRSRTVPTVLSGLLLAAAVLLGGFAVFTTRDPATNEPPGYAVRGGPSLTIHVAQGDQLHPYEEGTAVGAGDVLGFRVVGGKHQGVVLLSVDGTGMISVFFPGDGLQPEPLQGAGEFELPGTVMLDGAPGPEVFVAVFDQRADHAKALVRQTYWAEGHAGLRRLGERADVAVAEVRRR